MLAANCKVHSPSKFHLHRAPTANDHKGYLSAWAATGLDKEMHHISQKCETSSFPQAGTNIIGHTNLHLVQVDRIYLHQRDDLQAGLDEIPSCCGEGVMCSWETTSDSMDWYINLSFFSFCFMVLVEKF